MKLTITSGIRAGIALLALTLSSGCQNKLHDENVALYKQNRELQEQLTDSQTKLKSAPDPAQLSSMQSEIAQRDQRIADLQSQLSKPAANATPEESNMLKGIEVTRDRAAGTLTVNLPGDILFASGSSDLKQSAKSTLDKVIAAIKKDYGSKQVYVDGHTDSDPIVKTKAKWEDNLDLSAARARSVAQYLSSQGLTQNHLATRAFGATQPRGDKSHSRRVEIVVLTK